jgi:hypothetical protein
MLTPVPTASLSSQGTLHTLTLGALRMTIDAAKGARIAEFSYDHKNVLAGPEINPANYGSTFWPSPQSLWGWPPVPALDSAPYSGGREPGGDSFLFTSAPGRLGDGTDAATLTVSKRFAPAPDLPAIDVTFTVANVSPARVPPIEVAPWQITRVRGTRGLTFFALGHGPVRPAPELPIHVENGVGWYAFAPATCDSKSFADGKGWLAHVTADHLLFVQRFEDIAPEDSPAGESEIEVYTGPPEVVGDYVELESQGRKQRLAPGESLSYTVRFLLCALPANLAATVGNFALVDFVESL